MIEHRLSPIESEPNILSLPNEIFKIIASYLLPEITNIARIERTCVTLKGRVDQVHIWHTYATTYLGMKPLEEEINGLLVKNDIKRILCTCLGIKYERLCIASIKNYKKIRKATLSRKLAAAVAPEEQRLPSRERDALDLLVGGANPSGNKHLLSSAIRKKCSPSLILHLLKYGAELAHTDDNGNILYLAVQEEYIDHARTMRYIKWKDQFVKLLEVLISFGAKPPKSDQFNILERALEGSAATEVIELLIKIGAQPSKRIINCALSFKSNASTIKLLFEAGAKPNNEDNSRNSLYCAFNANSTPEVIGRLISSGAKPSKSAIDYAIEMNNESLIEILRSNRFLD